MRSNPGRDRRCHGETADEPAARAAVTGQGAAVLQRRALLRSARLAGQAGRQAARIPAGRDFRRNVA
jgi:hypothetical protein